MHTQLGIVLGLLAFLAVPAFGQSTPLPQPEDYNSIEGSECAHWIAAELKARYPQSETQKAIWVCGTDGYAYACKKFKNGKGKNCQGAISIAGINPVSTITTAGTVPGAGFNDLGAPPPAPGGDLMAVGPPGPPANNDDMAGIILWLLLSQ